MARHVMHVAVPTFVEPPQQMRFVFDEIEMGNADRCKPEPGRESLEFVS